MTPQQRTQQVIEQMIGNLQVQVATLLARAEVAEARVKELEAQLADRQKKAPKQAA